MCNSSNQSFDASYLLEVCEPNKSYPKGNSQDVKNSPCVALSACFCLIHCLVLCVLLFSCRNGRLKGLRQLLVVGLQRVRLIVGQCCILILLKGLGSLSLPVPCLQAEGRVLE